MDANDYPFGKVLFQEKLSTAKNGQDAKDHFTSVTVFQLYPRISEFGLTPIFFYLESKHGTPNFSTGNIGFCSKKVFKEIVAELKKINDNNFQLYNALNHNFYVYIGLNNQDVEPTVFIKTADDVNFLYGDLQAHIDFFEMVIKKMEKCHG